MTGKTPDTSDAEKWIDTDTFLYKGKFYTITPQFQVVEVKENTSKD